MKKEKGKKLVDTAVKDGRGVAIVQWPKKKTWNPCAKEIQEQIALNLKSVEWLGHFFDGARGLCNHRCIGLRIKKGDECPFCGAREPRFAEKSENE